MAGFIKHAFPGSNTHMGFYSYYHYLIPEDANRIFVLKGGPGVGKSSFMKKVGLFFQDKGYNIEFHHCSSDNNSLDGVVIPSLSVALVDGTAPHTIDPKFPGAVDEIIHLGDYWRCTNLEKNKTDIISSSKLVSAHFNRAYKYLGATKLILDDIIEKHRLYTDQAKINLLYFNIINEVFCDLEPTNNLGKERHLFGSALTPNGHIDYTESLLNNINKLYFIKGRIGTGKTSLLKKIYTYAINLGYDVEVYHTPLIPENIETIVISDLRVAFTTQKSCDKEIYKTINLNTFLDTEKLAKFDEEIEESSDYCTKLLGIAIDNIRLAKAEHDELEKFYVPNMYFDLIEKRRLEVVEKIASYID